MFLQIAGVSPELESLETQVRQFGLFDQVNFLGHLNRKKIRDLIRRSHCIVSSSYAETFGLTLVEAVALGKPAIATYSNQQDSISE